MAYLNAISYYLPEEILDNSQLNSEFPEWSVDKISSKTGIYERRISAENQFSSDLGYQAAINLFDEYQIDPKSIDFLLLCTQSPDYFLPTTACILQNKLNIPTNAGALDFNLGCSGFVYGLSLAKGLIASGAASRILLITAETYSKFINKRDKSNRTIFGDAASASLISNEKKGGFIGDFSFGTDGSGAEKLIVRGRGMRYKDTLASNDASQEEGVRADNDLFMDGPAIFNFTSQAVPVLVRETLVKNNLEIGDPDLFVFHQANQFMLEHIRKKVQIPSEKFYIYLRNCGNTVSSTIPIALYHAQAEKQIIEHKKVLIAGFGVGYSWAGTVLQY